MPERVWQLQRELSISQAQLDRMNALCGSNPHANETTSKLCTALRFEDVVSGMLCVQHMAWNLTVQL